MSYEISGKIIEIGDTQQISDTFKKREFVIENLEEIPGRPDPISNYVKFQMTQNRVDLVDPYEVGQDVRVNFNIRGNKWQNREGQTTYFTNLEAWRINENSPVSAPPPASSGDSTPPPPSGPAPDFSVPEEDDVLPF